MKEKLSALLDAELKGRERDHILSECQKNPDLRKLWQRYHLIGAALRKELEIVPEPNLADRIVKNLQDTDGKKHRLNFLFERSPTKFFFTTTAALVFLAALIVPLTVLTPTDVPDSAKQTSGTSGIAAGSGTLNRQQHEWEEKLYSLLIEHNEFSQISNMNGVMSYVRLAGYDDHPE